MALVDGPGSITAVWSNPHRQSRPLDERAGNTVIRSWTRRRRFPMLVFMQDNDADNPQPTAGGEVGSLAGERYMALTTYRSDGTPRSVPVWPVDAGGGRIGFVTSSRTWKVRRIMNNSAVEVQPSDARGRTKSDTEPIPATAQVVEGSEFERINARVKAKYGIQLRIINLFHALPGSRTGHRNDCAVILTGGGT